MNKTLTYAVIAILVSAGGLWYFVLNKPTQPVSQPAVTQETAVPVPSASASASPAVVVNLSQQNASGESGTATLMEVDGKVKVILKLTGAKVNVTQPAHIHVGKCPDVGAVKYPLTFPVNGTSETMLAVTLAQLKSQLPLGVNVHKSATEAKVYVSCGDINL